MWELPEWRTVTQTNTIKVEDFPERTQIEITETLGVHIHNKSPGRKQNNHTYEISVVQLEHVFKGTGLETCWAVKTLTSCVKTLSSMESAKKSALRMAHSYATERLQKLSNLIQTANDMFDANTDVWDKSRNGKIWTCNILPEATLLLHKTHLKAIDGQCIFDVEYTPEDFRTRVYADNTQEAIAKSKERFLTHLHMRKQQTLDDCDAIHVLRTTEKH